MSTTDGSSSPAGYRPIVSIGETMQDFLLNLNTDHTRQTYTTPLKHFAVYLSGQGIRVDHDLATALSVDHAIGFVPWLRHEYFTDPEQPAKATLQLYLTAVYRFYRSLLKRGIAFEAADIARLEETYRDARNIHGESRPKDPKLAAVEALIRVARSVAPGSGDKPADRNRELARLRDIAIVETLRSTGCRVGELASLRRGDLDWFAHSALVKGKGSKYRKVYLDSRAWMAVKAYLQAREDGAHEDGRTLARLPLFCGHGNRSGRQPACLTTRHVARIIEDLAEKADLAEIGITPHYFRHVFATRALDRTENLALVQDMMGHASPATTRVYARTDERQRREGYARVWDESQPEEEPPETLAEESASYEATIEEIGEPVKWQADEEDLAGPLGSFSAASAAAIRGILASAHCSLNELVSLRLRDVDFEARTCRLDLPTGPHVATLAASARAALAAYVHLRLGMEARGMLSDSDVLFLHPDNQPLTTDSAYEMLWTAAQEEGWGESELEALL